METSAKSENVAATEIAGSLLYADNTIGDLLEHPALQGFAHRILPWANQDYDRDLPLGAISRLLPYHSEVRPQTVLDGINRVITDSQAGRSVFHEIYSKAERKADPTLANAGLFFFQGTPGAPFAIVAPGGGFSYVACVHEGFPHALRISAMGYNAFVLTYRTGQGERVANQDLARAIDNIMAQADKLQVARDGYALWGSSAGARMAASIGSHGPDAYGAQTTARPSAVVMAYTSHSDIGLVESPTYVIVGEHDGISPPRVMQLRVRRLQAMGTDFEFRVVPGLGHGFGAGIGTEAEGWIGDAVRFWTAHLPET